LNRSPYALIVEDLDFWQEALSEILTDAGYRVCAASSYDEAVDALDHNEFHLALIDPVLDDTNPRNRDGLRILQHILDRQPEMGTVVVTASDPNRIRREVREMSADIPLLYKDKWDDVQFLDLVNELLDVRRDA
jgi:DNA-binding NtrC family response regulator